MSSDSAEIMYSFGLLSEQQEQSGTGTSSAQQLPAIFVVPAGGDSKEVLKYGGEMLSLNLQEFVVQYIEPEEMTELVLDNAQGMFLCFNH